MQPAIENQGLVRGGQSESTLFPQSFGTAKTLVSQQCCSTYTRTSETPGSVSGKMLRALSHTPLTDTVRRREPPSTQIPGCHTQRWNLPPRRNSPSSKRCAHF